MRQSVRNECGKAERDQVISDLKGLEDLGPILLPQIMAILRLPFSQFLACANLKVLLQSLCPAIGGWLFIDRSKTNWGQGSSALYRQIPDFGGRINSKHWSPRLELMSHDPTVTYKPALWSMLSWVVEAERSLGFSK